MKQYQAQTQSQMRKWTMKSPLFDTKSKAREWIINKRTICQAQEESLKVFKNAYINLYSEGQKVGIIEKFSFNALGIMNSLKVKRKVA